MVNILGDICADNKPVSTKRKSKDFSKKEGSGAWSLSSEKRRVHKGLHYYTKETELGFKEGSESKINKQYGSNRLYSWRRS